VNQIFIKESSNTQAQEFNNQFKYILIMFVSASIIQVYYLKKIKILNLNLIN
jgi:hypothetical protein